MIDMRMARASFCCFPLGALVTLFWGRDAGEQQEPDARVALGAALGAAKTGHSYIALFRAPRPEAEEAEEEETEDGDCDDHDDVVCDEEASEANEECDLDNILGLALIKVGAGRDDCLDGSLLLEELGGGLRNLTRLRVHDYLRFQAFPACLDLRTLAPALVSLEITHCPLGGIQRTIHDLDLTLPPRLRRLILSYNGLTDFEVSLPRSLRVVDLSFNKLRRVPTCLEEIRDLVRRPAVQGGPTCRVCRVNLANNDFWYGQGTDVPLSLVNQESILELTRAHDWGLLSGVRLKRAMDYLNARRLIAAVVTSANCGLHVHVARAATTYSDGQNVHMPSVQRTVRDAVQRVMSPSSSHDDGHYNHKDKDRNSPYSNYYVNGLVKGMRLKGAVARKFRRDCAEPSVHRELNITYGSLCQSLYSFLRAEVCESNAEEIFRRMGEEYTRTKDTCFTGRITHLLAALNGLVPGFAVGIDGREELGNSLARVRNKWAALAGTDFDKYIAGAVPEAMQVLEDACVPEGEQDSWLTGI